MDKYISYAELRDYIRAEEERYGYVVAQRTADARAIQSTGPESERVRAELALLEQCQQDAAEHERRIDAIYGSLAPEDQFEPIDSDEHEFDWLDRKPLAVPLESLS